MAVFRRSHLLHFAHLEFAHLDSCPLLLLGLCLTGLFLWLFPSLERELVDGSEEELIQSFSSSSGKLQTHRVSWVGRDPQGSSQSHSPREEPHHVPEGIVQTLLQLCQSPCPKQHFQPLDPKGKAAGEEGEIPILMQSLSQQVTHSLPMLRDWLR